MAAAPSLEQVIQPLASPLNQDRVIASIQKQPPELSELRWGAAGTLPSPVEQVSPGVGFTLNDPYQQTWTEIPGSRKTENVTVSNPSDSSQYVTVQRIDAIGFSSPNNQQPSVSFTGFPVTSGGTTSSGDDQSVQQSSIPAGGSVSATYNLNNSSYDSGS